MREGMMMLTVDGAQGEGGGQILRSALTLSLATGTPFRMVNIRAGRPRPGLMRQHLTAVQAAQAVGDGQVEGAEIGSQDLTFHPGKVRADDYHLTVGTAGSTTLVLQTILPALALATGKSTVVLEGGTHNPLSPTFEFLERAFLPIFRRMGPRVAVRLERRGFYPAGGGKLVVVIDPVDRLTRIDLCERGAFVAGRATAVVSALPAAIAHRELQVLEERLGWSPESFVTEEERYAHGPGNVVSVELASEQLTEVITGFGRKGVPAEEVAAGVADEVKDYLASDAPVGPHLADQLLLPMALAGGGSLRTSHVTPHARSQIALLQNFLALTIHLRERPDGTWLIRVGD